MTLVHPHREVENLTANSQGGGGQEMKLELGVTASKAELPWPGPYLSAHLRFQVLLWSPVHKTYADSTLS